MRLWNTSRLSDTYTYKPLCAIKLRWAGHSAGVQLCNSETVSHQFQWWATLLVGRALCWCAVRVTQRSREYTCILGVSGSSVKNRAIIDLKWLLLLRKNWKRVVVQLYCYAPAHAAGLVPVSLQLFALCSLAVVSAATFDQTYAHRGPAHHLGISQSLESN